MDRRELIKIAAAGWLAGQQASAQHSHHDGASAPDVVSYRPRFFSDAEYRAAGILCDILRHPMKCRQGPGKPARPITWTRFCITQRRANRSSGAWSTKYR